jgi:hypothetical protein
MAWPAAASPYERRSIIRGMRVRDGSGRKLGHVALIGEEHLFVRRWPFSRHWFAVPRARVTRVTRGAVILEGVGAELLRPADPRLLGEIPTQTAPLAEPQGWGDSHA